MQKKLKYSEQIENAGNLFFLKKNILKFEETHKHYREIPPGSSSREDENVCTEKGLAAFVSRTIFEMNTGRVPTPEEEQKISIAESRLWTWLGPIEPKIPESKTFKPSDNERQEIIEFANLARALRQMGKKNEVAAIKSDEKCLAQMLKYRYPNLSKTEVYDFIFPDNDMDKKAKESQGTRWGIF